MANETENKYDSGTGHVVLPILHSGSGEVHDIAIPANTDPGELHDALLNGNYHGPSPYLGPNVDALGHPKKGPSRSGVLENSPEFKKAASAVWEAAGRGRNTSESGTYLDQDLERGPIVSSNTEGKMSLVVPKDAQSTLHTHPDHFNGTQAGGQPSDVDIATAKKLGKSVYVVSKSGLQVVEKDGKVTNVFNNPDWTTRDNK
jgi:hypothetical protein